MFVKDEESNVESFAKELASIADAYINDAFGTAHRAHASVSGVPALLPKEKCGVGCLVASEVAYLDFSQLGEGEKVAASKLIQISTVNSCAKFIVLLTNHIKFVSSSTASILQKSHWWIEGFFQVTCDYGVS